METEKLYPDGELYHYGTPRHSGRYPWGSGKDPYQSAVSFRSRIAELKRAGMSEVEIAKSFGMNTTQLRNEQKLAKARQREYDASLALKLHDKGWSNTAIAERMGRNESSVRNLLNPTLRERNNAIAANAKILKDQVDKYDYIDVSEGTAQQLGISEGKLNAAIQYAKREGYALHKISYRQMTTGKPTRYYVLCKPGTTWAQAQNNQDKIHLMNDVYAEDEALKTVTPPREISRDVVSIRYAEDGGTQRDGLIELRRGVPELNLGENKYAQVRIAVDGGLYLKGMAIYADDLPDGVNVRFNTNKHKGTSFADTLKSMESDPDRPFGSTIKDDSDLIRAQRHYIDKDGKEQLSALNIVKEEGDVARWTRSLPSQFLSKQNPKLAKRQLDIDAGIARSQLDDLLALTNPTVKSKLLEDFADELDRKATDLAAAPLPGQTNKLILPFPQLKDNEAYIPNLNTGDRVALVRFPHGGTFEIPTLTVNNKVASVRKALSNAADAIGINANVAERLSGADFDGDTVLVLPVNNVNIKSTPALERLKNFDPKEEYRGFPGMRVMTDREKGLEMGKVTNLITDMTVQNATLDEIARAVRHSMVVIDAVKHKLDWKRSEAENDIADLRAKYQPSDRGPNGGASTLLSRSTSPVNIAERKLKPLYKMTDEEKKRYYDGYNVYEETGAEKNKPVTRKDEAGNEEIVDWTKTRATQEVSRMSLAEDAYELTSGGSREKTTLIESIYADYANEMKAMAREARKAARSSDDIQYDANARKVYADEWRSLRAKLDASVAASPLERQAQRLANSRWRPKAYSNGWPPEKRKKEASRELTRARNQLGAKRLTIDITDREWEAINAGAISPSFLREVLARADSDRLKQLATPRQSSGISAGLLSRARSMLKGNYTQAEVANLLGVSVSALSKALNA